MDETQQGPQGIAPPADAADAGPSQAVISGIARTGPWVRFIAVLGFISTALMAAIGLVVMLAGGAMSELGAGMGFLIGLFYLAMAAVYLIPIIPLNRFANEASRLRANPSLAVAAKAIEQSRSFWLRAGVLAIIGLALIPVAFIISIVVAVMNH